MNRLTARIGPAGIDPHGVVYVDVEFFERDAPGNVTARYPTQRVPIDPDDDLEHGADRIVEAILTFGRNFDRFVAVQAAMARYVGAEIDIRDELAKRSLEDEP